MAMRRRGAGLDEIERVYRARLDEYVRVASAVLGDSDAARDAVQEAFASAVRNRRSFRGDGPLDAWLWRAVVNAALCASRPAAADGRPSCSCARRADRGRRSS